MSRETHQSFGGGVVDQRGDERVKEDKGRQQGQQRRPKSKGGKEGKHRDIRGERRSP